MKHSWTAKGFIAILFLMVIFLAACGPAEPPDETEINSDNKASSEVTTTTNTNESVPAPSETDPFDIFAGIDEDDIVTTSSGLQYIELEAGDGRKPETGEVVSVHYTGWLEDGTKFDSSVDRGTPFQFALGLGAVIAGWDEGVALMNQGGKARLIIPSELGYGEFGSGSTIPPNATLVFDVEVLDISEGAPEHPTEVDEDELTTTDSGLQYYDIEVGEGPTPEAGQQILFHYTGWLEDGSLFDSSLNRGQPVAFIIGDGQVIPGWEEGFATMKAGGKRLLIIPPELAFGEAGAGNGIIPPNATLIFEMELIEVQ